METATQNKIQLHTLSVVLNHNLNAFSRVIGIFSGRGFEIDSVSFGTGSTDNLARLTLTTNGDEKVVEQITKQLHKIVDVLKVTDLTHERFVARELALVKISATEKNRSEVMQIAQVFKAKVIDISPEKISTEVTGNRDKIDAYIAMLRPFGISEVARTGTVALKREYKGTV